MRLAAASGTAVVGLVVGVAGLPGKIGEALGHSSSKTANAGVEEARADLAAAGPRLDVSYLFLTTDLAQAGGPETIKKHKATPQAVTILSYPSIRDGVLDELDASSNGCRLAKYPQNSVVYLVLQNRGRRDASNISVQVSKLELRGVVRIREGDAGSDYVSKLRAKTRAASPLTIRLPETLGPGEGVRVPLWISAAAYGRPDPWCVISRTALKPSSVRFTDPVLDSSTTVAVRRLAAPVLLGEGIEGRG